jgi:Asp-tRNA(Asn)/Glu-tRNA(Gln) amidotransferase B subunit
VDPARVEATELAKLVEARDRIPRSSFDEAISKLGDEGFSADPYLAQEAVSDTGELGAIVDRILEDNPGQVAAYRGGKEGLLGFFVGQVMKETQGKANARVVSELVREKLAT